MKTAIIIVNYKTPWHLKECLKSIFKHTSNFHIILVHNGIDKESIRVSDEFEKRYPGYFTVIKNEKNLGLVGGVNSAYEEGIKYERVCFLNSDIVVTKGWLEELNKSLDENPNAMQVAPDLNQYYQESLFWRIIKWQVMPRFPRLGSAIYKRMMDFNPPRSAQSNEGFRVATEFYHFCTGACNLIRTKPFIERGFFWDPNIIHGYGDDFDTSYYLREFGDIGVNNRAYVFHFINISFNKLSPERAELKSRLQMYNRFYVINKWRDRIRKDLNTLSQDNLLHLTQASDEVRMMVNYFGIIELDPSFQKFIETIPAKQIGEKLLN